MDGRSLDGEINRALEGKKVTAVSKDGVFMTIHCDNGEKWNVGFADFIAGKGFAGEPALISIDDMRDAGNPLPTDGSVNSVLEGQVIEHAITDGITLYLQCATGRRIGIGWVDDRGERVRAEPCLHKVDAVLTLDGVAVFGAEMGNTSVEILIGDHANCGGQIMRRGNRFYCRTCGWDSANG